MSHFLKTINPQEADRIGAGGPDDFPSIGDTVIYFPRPGELRPGRGQHFAMVTGSNEQQQVLDLVVVFDCDDMIGQRNVPRRSLDGGAGWEPRKVHRPAAPSSVEGIESLRSTINMLEERIKEMNRTIFGDFELPTESVLAVINEHDERIASVERKAKQSTVLPAAKAQKAKAKAKDKAPAPVPPKGK
jgi:hypothetical protein